MVTSEALEGGQPGGEKLPPAPPLSKILVAVAGPFMNVVFAFVIATVIYFVGLPVLVDPPIVGTVDPESAEAKAGIQQGDKIVQVDGRRVKAWNDMVMATVLARTNVIPVVVERAGIRVTNYLTAVVNEELGWKMLNLNPLGHPEVMQVIEGGAGEAAGLKSQDVVLSFAGVPTAGREQLIELIQKRGGQATEMVVKRDGETKTVSVTPRLDPQTGKGRIGVALGSSNTYVEQRPGPTPWEQVADVWDKTISTLGALFHSKETGVGVKDLSGPPGILAMLAAQIKADYRLALSFLVLLNINLAILNLLPVPVLDGGHIMMAIFEKIRGKPLNVRFVEYTTTAFAVLLISFMLYVSYNDIAKRFGLFKALIESDTKIEKAEPAPVNPAPIEAPAR
jgi:regulator of sigma E protease